MSIQQGSGFSSGSVYCQDPGGSGQVQLRPVAGALQESTGSPAEELDLQRGGKWGDGHSAWQPQGQGGKSEGPAFTQVL